MLPTCGHFADHTGGPQPSGMEEIGMVMAPQVESEEQNARREATGKRTQVVTLGPHLSLIEC